MSKRPQSLLDTWCETKHLRISARDQLHLLHERDGARATVEQQIDAMVVSHYEDPRILSERIARVGLQRAAKVLQALLPRSKKARSGHLGEIFATEAAPAVLKSFEIPIKRLRWLDGREAALRGEDLIGVERGKNTVRFLKGESKSRNNLTPAVVAQARKMLLANDGRPSEHALAFVMHRLFELGQDELAILFEEHMLAKSIAPSQMVHLLFTLSGNDAEATLQDDLKACSTRIAQHAIALRIPDHQKFIADVYDRINAYGARN